GGLPLFAACDSPFPSAVVHHSKTGFGTAIALSGSQPIEPIPMLVTPVRLGDYSVGLLFKRAAPMSTAWAPAGLLHVRAAETGSGRGALADYLDNEDLSFPLMDALQGECERTRDDPGLEPLSKALQKQAEIFRLPRGYADLLYCHAEES